HLEQIVPIRPKARHNALSHSGAIAVIAPDRLVIAIGALRHIDRRAVPIAVIALDQSQIVRLIHNVEVFLQITYLPSITYSHVILQLYHFFNTITSPAFNSSSILTKPPSRDSSSSSLSQIMPNTEKITFAKLSGGDNYTYWALRMDSLLIREKLQGALGSKTHNKSEEALALIRLQLEDGPLTQIMHIKTASEAWNRLKELYNPVSFTSNFLLTKELLEI
ncbi:hypothetical protein L249_7462, partial [Ophiocordyceps polyrhachis-furcata BCC 54312]